MHPGMFAWWQAHRHAACREMAYGDGPAGCSPGGGGRWGGYGHPGHAGHEGGGGEDFGVAFGVRRPLRFLAYRLDLGEKQVADLAAILSELKTERAQAAVDQRRTTSALADAIASDTFDEPKAKAAAEERTRSNERVQQALARALSRIHAMLDPEQRAKLAYLLRTGGLSI